MEDAIKSLFEDSRFKRVQETLARNEPLTPDMTSAFAEVSRDSGLIREVREELRFDC